MSKDWSKEYVLEIIQKLTNGDERRAYNDCNGCRGPIRVEGWQDEAIAKVLLELISRIEHLEGDQ